MHHDYMANMMMQERQREIARSFATANAGRPKRRTMALRPWDRRRRSIRAEIAKAKVLFDSGALTQSEFDAIKAKAIPQEEAVEAAGLSEQAPSLSGWRHGEPRAWL